MIFKEDRQPREIMAWVSSIRAKQFKDLPEDALKVLNKTYSKEVKANDYIPTYPGSPLFKEFLTLWEKNYSPLKGETVVDIVSQKTPKAKFSETQSSEAIALLKERKATLDEGKIDVSVMNFFTDAMAKIKEIKDTKLQEKAVEDLARDFIQYIKNVERFTTK